MFTTVVFKRKKNKPLPHFFSANLARIFAPKLVGAIQFSHELSVLEVHMRCLNHHSQMSYSPLDHLSFFTALMDWWCHHRHNKNQYLVNPHYGGKLFSFIHSPFQLPLSTLCIKIFFCQGRWEANAIGPNYARSISIFI